MNNNIIYRLALVGIMWTDFSVTICFCQTLVTIIVAFCLSTDALRSHPVSSHVLPQILEDEAEETMDELLETSKERRQQVEDNGKSGGNKSSRSEGSDHGTMNSEGFVSGAVTPTSLEEGQTDILRLRSETTTPDSGYNMSQS